MGKYYNNFLHEYQNGIPPDTTRIRLVKLLKHCEQQVPYYSKIIKEIGGPDEIDPFIYIARFPILSRDLLRKNFEELKSLDLDQRKWFLNSTGGSTGEPVQFIQDWEFASQAGAIKILFSKLVGREIGEREVRLWGNIHDITSNTESWRAQLINRLENATFVNSSLMTSRRLQEYIRILNTADAKLILAYAETIFEIAKFAEKEGYEIHPQSAIMTSAAKLYPFMREKIEGVFQCKVYDRYGSRELGDIGCERPNFRGLWVAPWGNYVEIVDPNGNRVADGTEGEILVTSLTNYAMPLIRYKIGDRGMFISSTYQQHNHHGQVLKEVIGRSMDFFQTRDGTLINSGFLMAQLYFREWIAQYQIIQKSYSHVAFRIVKIDDPPQTELDEIIAITKRTMRADCCVTFEFVDAIPASASGKYRFLLSEVS